MNNWIDSVLVLLVVTNLVLVGSSRLWGCIQVVAIQGILLGVLQVASHSGELTVRTLLEAGGAVLVKSGIFPALLYRACRETDVSRKVEPFIGYSTSTAIGIGLLLISIWLGHRLPLPTQVLSPLVVPVALSTILTGLFLIVSRKKALTQVLGYLVLENGIFAFGVALVIRVPLSVELGILLDLLVAVLVMGITIFNINRGFDSIDTMELTRLRD